MNSYDLNGNKQSFANWISMLRTYETPFLNLVKTEKVNHALFSWQTDKLAATDKDNKEIEGSDAASGFRAPTKVHQNVTQILSKVVKVSDTAAKIESWGRNKETAYQMEKAGKELFKDLEWAFLNNVAMEPGNNSRARITAGVRGLAADINVPCPVTGAVTHRITDKEITEDDLFDLTYNLYLAGSKANLICYHPSMALFFSNLMESDTKARIFKNNSKLMLEVYSMVDPLGQRYALVPMRQMPLDTLYAFNAKDFTQMILRSPRRVMLDRDGSYDKWLLDIEIGLRLDNPYACGVLQRMRDSDKLLKKQRLRNVVTNKNTAVPPGTEADAAIDFVTVGGTWSPTAATHEVTVAQGSPLSFIVTSAGTRPDKLQLKVYDITNAEPDHTVISQFFESDEHSHKATMTQALVVTDKKYRIECRGYIGSHYVRQILGNIHIK